MRELRLWTFTSEYVEVFVDGVLVRADVQYHGSMPVCIIDGITYVVSRIKG